MIRQGTTKNHLGCHELYILGRNIVMGNIFEIWTFINVTSIFIYDLLNDEISTTSDYTASSVGLVDSKLETMRNEAVVA
jgi:hypothetical protein